MYHFITHYILHVISITVTLANTECLRASLFCL